MHSITESGYAFSDFVAREKRHRTTVWARWAASVEMVGREKKARRQVWAARYRKKEARARDKTREEIYLFSRAGSCPRESGAVSRRKAKRNETMLTSLTLYTMKVEGQ